MNDTCKKKFQIMSRKVKKKQSSSSIMSRAKVLRIIVYIVVMLKLVLITKVDIER